MTVAQLEQPDEGAELRPGLVVRRWIRGAGPTAGPGLVEPADRRLPDGEEREAISTEGAGTRAEGQGAQPVRAALSQPARDGGRVAVTAGPQTQRAVADGRAEPDHVDAGADEFLCFRPGARRDPDGQAEGSASGVGAPRRTGPVVADRW